MTENITLQPNAAPYWIRHRAKLLIGLVLAQTLFLLGIAGSYYAVDWYGKEIRIQTAPVDPRDLLYGDHVILNYDISSLNAALWKETNEELPEQGDVVYVVMKSTSTSIDAPYIAVGIYASRPSVQLDEAVLKARVGYTYDKVISLTYGIESYYVPENTGKELEEQVGSMLAVIKIAPWGSAIIKGLEVQDK